MTMYDLKDEVVELDEIREVAVLNLNVGTAPGMGAIDDLINILVNMGDYITEIEKRMPGKYRVTIKERQL